jgi:dephospho-CoA kinase
LNELKTETAIKTYDSLLGHLLTFNHTEYPTPTREAIMADRSPVIITGLPGSGKTFFLKGLVSKLDIPVFVLDVHNEYEGLESVNLGEFFGLDFSKTNKRLRFIPNVNVAVSKSEADSIFRHLIMLQKSLQYWVFVIEEGHRFSDSPFLKSFLAEARKFTEKVIVVSHQPEPYKGLGQVFEVRRPLGN